MREVMKKFKTIGGHTVYLKNKDKSVEYGGGIIVYGEFINPRGAYGFWNKEGMAIRMFGFGDVSLDAFNIANFFQRDFDELKYSDEEGI